MVKISKVLIILIGIYSILFVGFLTLAVSSDPSFEPWETAILKMALTLIVVWIIILGSLMYFFRDKIKKFVLKIPMGWKKKFVLFAIFLALVEEAITTTITTILLHQQILLKY